MWFGRNPNWFSVWIVFGLVPVFGAEIFVGPNGRATGHGSREQPIDLQTAISERSPAKPGDTIWLLGGTYPGKFTSDLKGKPGAPIQVRSSYNEWAKLDSGRSSDRQNILLIRGAWTIFRDFEVTSSDRKRNTRIGGSYPEDIKRGEGIHVRGSNIKLINLVVHDAALGIAAWSEAPDTEIYGCLIYNNGWQGPDRAHGHGIYSQNRIGRKLLNDNIIFNQFDKGIQVYGSSAADLKNYLIEGNTIFNNGIISAEGALSENIILYGGATGPEGIVIRDNLFYGTGFDGKVVLGGAGAKDLVLEDNYIPQSLRLRHWKSAVIVSNTWVRDDTMIELHLGSNSQQPSYRWDYNSYFFCSSQAEGAPFELRRVFTNGESQANGLFFHAWRSATRFDQNSQYRREPPVGRVFVRANRYEKGRAHITVYNWELKPSVDVDLGEILDKGQPYKIFNAQDYFGNPVAAGFYDSKPVELRMSGLKTAAPAGLSPPPSTGPEFNMFVLRGE